MRLSLRHLAAFSSALPSQVVPSFIAAFQLGCFAKDCFSAWSEAEFVNGFVGMNTFLDTLESGTPVSLVPAATTTHAPTITIVTVTAIDEPINPLNR